MLRKNSAFTLVELLATMTSASLLVLGMTSTIYIALQASDASTNPAKQTCDGINAISQLEYDLTYAKDVLSGTATNLEISVADRDGDLVDDRITYNWREASGQPLTRTFNSEDPKNLIESVHALEFAYTENEAKELLYIDLQATIGDRQRIVSGSFLMRNRP